MVTAHAGAWTLQGLFGHIALPRLAAEGILADAALVDGSRLFSNVFIGLYYLQMILRPIENGFAYRNRLRRTAPAPKLCPYLRAGLAIKLSLAPVGDSRIGCAIPFGRWITRYVRELLLA